MGLEQYRLEASGFNNRAVGVLLRAGVKDIKDIAERFGEYELKRLPNCGKETVQHIKAVLKKHKIKLSHGTATTMTQPSDRARKAEVSLQDLLDFLGNAFRNIDLPPLSHHDLGDIHASLRAFAASRATFERGVEAAAKCAEAETGVYPHGNQMYGSAVPGKIAKAIRNLTPAPPADLCADIAQKSADAIKGQDDGP